MNKNNLIKRNTTRVSDRCQAGGTRGSTGP